MSARKRKREPAHVVHKNRDLRIPYATPEDAAPTLMQGESPPEDPRSQEALSSTLPRLPVSRVGFGAHVCDSQMLVCREELRSCGPNCG